MGNDDVESGKARVLVFGEEVIEKCKEKRHSKKFRARSNNKRDN